MAIEQRTRQGRRALAKFVRGLESLAFQGWREFLRLKRRILGRAAYVIGPGRVVHMCFNTWQASDLAALSPTSPRAARASRRDLL